MKNNKEIETILCIIIIYVVILMSDEYKITSQPLVALTSTIIYILIARILIIKGYMSINSINDKWRKYNEIDIVKKATLEEYCKNNKLNSFWYTIDFNRKFYRNI